MFAALERLMAGVGGARAERLDYDMAILRAVLLRARPQAEEAARLTHLFRRLAAAEWPAGVKRAGVSASRRRSALQCSQRCTGPATLASGPPP